MKKLAVVLGVIVGLGLAFYFSFLFSGSGVQGPAPGEKPGAAAPGAGERAAPGPPGTARGPEALPTVPTAPEPDLGPPAPPPPPAPAAEPSPPPPAPVQDYGFLAGRFKSRQEARRARERIARQDFPTFLEEKGGVLELWVGPFSSPEQAASAQKLLKVPGRIVGWSQKREPVPK